MTLPVCQVCGGEAVIFSPGDAGERIELRGSAIVLRAEVPDRAWCLPDAQAAGVLAWPSERTAARRQRC